MLNNLTVKARLFFLIGILSILSVFLSIGGLYAMKKTNDSLKTVYHDRTLPLADLSEIKNNLLHTRTAIVTSFSYPKEATEQLKKVEKNMEDVDKLWIGYMTTYLTPEEKILADKFAMDYQIFFKNLKNDIAFQRAGDMEEAKRFYFENVRASYKTCALGIDALVKLQKDVAKQEYEAGVSRYEMSFIVAIVLLILGLATAVFVGFVIVKKLVKELGGEPDYLADLARKIANDKLDNDIKVSPDDTDSLLATMRNMQQQLSARTTAERKAAHESLYLKTALDNITSNVMVADNDRNIAYMNLAARTMLRNVEADLRNKLPGFDSNKLLGANIDIFHENPAHQKHLLANLEGTIHSEIAIAGHTFGLNANPIRNKQGERFGTVVEWKDRTAEVAVEQRITKVLNSAGLCDFSRYI